jgi:hypothetical protein
MMLKKLQTKRQNVIMLNVQLTCCIGNAGFTGLHAVYDFLNVIKLNVGRASGLTLFPAARDKLKQANRSRTDCKRA